MKLGTRVGIAAAAAAAAWLAVAPVQARAADDGVEVRIGRGSQLGVSLGDVSAADVARLKLAEESGAVVADVRAGSAAEKAGLKEGDVILRYQGEAVHSATQLSRMVRETPPGRKVVLDVSRGGAVQKLTATLEEGRGKRLAFGEGFAHLGESFPNIEIPEPPEPPEVPIPPMAFSWNDRSGRAHDFVLRDRLRIGGPRRLGLSYQEITGQLAEYFKVQGKSALLVASVDADGPAAKAGVKAGDVLLKIDGKSIEGAGDLRERLAGTEPGKEVTLTVQREGKPIDLKVTLGGDKTEKKTTTRRRGVTT